VRKLSAISATAATLSGFAMGRLLSWLGTTGQEP
jgi:hypothetical protein